MRTYARDTYDHPSFLVRYPHNKRNALVGKVIRDLTPSSWLDYGAGDGNLLTVLARTGSLPSEVVCFEPDQNMRACLSGTVSGIGSPSMTIVDVAEMNAGNLARYDLVTCLEVLEHLPLPERLKFYQFLSHALKPGGTCLIEVPVEFGPILLLKEFGRTIIKHKRGHHKPAELLSAVFIGYNHDSQLRDEMHDRRTFIQSHYGFSLKKLVCELEQIGEVALMLRTPFPFLPAGCNQSVLLEFKIDRYRLPEFLRLRKENAGRVATDTKVRSAGV